MGDAQLGGGDVAAASGLDWKADYPRLRDGVLALLRAELRDFALADDLCHEAFRIVLERLARQPLEDPSRLAAFLAQTARHLVMEHRKRVRLHDTHTGQQAAVEALTDPQPDASYAVLQETRVRAVRQLLQEMSRARDREILVRVYLEDQDKDEVCRALAIDDAHYKRVLHRARSRLAELLEMRYRPADLFCIALF